MNKTFASLRVWLAAAVLALAGRCGGGAVRTQQLSSYADETQRAFLSMRARTPATGVWLRYGTAEDLARNADDISRDALLVRTAWRNATPN